MGSGWPGLGIPAAVGLRHRPVADVRNECASVKRQERQAREINLIFR